MKPLAAALPLLIVLAACSPTATDSTPSDTGAATTPDTAAAASASSLLGGCILRTPAGEVPSDLYQQSDIVATDEYPPFTKKLSVYGITLILRDDISEPFAHKVAKAITEVFPQGGNIDPDLQQEVIRDLYRYKAVIPLFKGRTEEAGFTGDDEAAWDRTNSQNSICDIIMELGDDPGQVMEVVEHILHFVSDVGLSYAFPNDWGISSDSQLGQAMQKAVDEGYYQIDSYGDIGDQARERVILQEFAYWIISTAWNLQEPYGPVGEAEWEIVNDADLKAKLPHFHEVYERTVAKVMAAPSMATLEQIGPRRNAAPEQ